MAQTGGMKACWGDIEVYYEFQWQISSAKSWQSVDLTIQPEHGSPAQILPDASDAVQLWHSASPESITWTLLEQGPVSRLFHRGLQTTNGPATPAQPQPPRSSIIRFVFATRPGYLVRSDILPLRMVDLELMDSVFSFFAAQPERLFHPLPVDVTTETILHAITNNAVGGLLLRPLPGYLDDKDYVEVQQRLNHELTNRMSFPWVLDAPASRKTLAIVEGGRSSPEHGGTATSLYTAARALNIEMIVLDVPGHWLEGPQYAHWRKEFLAVDLEPPSLLSNRVLEALSGHKVDGIITFCDSYQVAVAQAASQLGLPTFSAEAYEIATDKYRTSVLEGRPAYLIYSLEEALDIVQRGALEYPFIVKPCKGFLSEGVFKVHGAEELTRAIQSVNLDRHGTKFVLEDYCDGPEVDINFILSNGKIVFYEISDDFPKTADMTGTDQNGAPQAPTSFIELGNVLPSKLPPAETALLRDSLYQSLTRLGLTTGIYHLEARVQHSFMEYGVVATDPTTKTKIIDLVPRRTAPTKRPYAWLIEINPRPPGIQETAAVESTYGVDYWGIGLLASLRDHPRLLALAHPFHQGPQYWCEIVFIPVTAGGRFESDNVCIDLKRRRPDLAQHVSKDFCFLRRGDAVPAPESGITAWVAYYIVFSRTGREHLLGLTEAVRRETMFTIV